MAEKINSLEQLVLKLQHAQSELHTNIKKVVARSAVKVQATAKSKFGHYQPAIGPYNAWSTLAIRTIIEKQNRGMEQDNPLIGAYGSHRFTPWAKKTASNKNGHLGNSILVELKDNGFSAEVGTNDKSAKVHEFGYAARKIPPRPYLRPALYQSQDWIKIQFKGAIATTLEHV